VIVNDVYVDPNQPQHVLLATDRGGVLRSEDSGMTFQPSNEGFTLRQVVAYAADQRDPTQLYVGVVNDKEVGGVFASSDGGVKWRQTSSGLGGRDVYSLTMTPDDTLLAGTSHGVFRMTNGIWSEASSLVPPPAPAKKPVTKKGAKVAAHSAAPAKKPEPKGPSPLSTAAVYALTSGSEGIYAGTSAGLWRSTDGAQGWIHMQVPQLTDGRYVASHGQMVVAASLTGTALSENGGESWTSVMPPATLTQIGALAIDGIGNIWIGGPEGVFYSTDRGASWKTLQNLFVRHVDGIYYDAVNKRVLVASTSGTVGFAASLPDYRVSYWDTGWALRFLRPVGDHLVGATLFDGVVVEPKMVASPFPGESSTRSAR
jgi:ligand-binding sensor domain-containing protein